MDKKEERNELMVQEYNTKEKQQFHFSEEKITVSFINNYQFYNENIPQITTLDYTVKSYFHSTIVLANQLQKFDVGNKDTYYVNYLYLPMMFSFRQYIELKMKYLYMCVTHKAFNTETHDLEKLREELKNTDFYAFFNGNNSSVDVVKFIKTLEKKPEYFRFVLDKECEETESLQIYIDTAEKVKYYCSEIESRIEMAQVCQKLHEMK
jgi:hypothetical protein